MCNYSVFKHCNFLISYAELKANYEHLRSKRKNFMSCSDNRELKQLGRELQRRRLLIRFPFSCLYNSCVSFSFCLKVCEYEN